MEIKELIIKEIDYIPENYLEEALDFMHYLRNKTRVNASECFLLSEKSLSKDWLSPEEDEAWKDL